MNITHHQLTTEDGQKKAVAKYVLAISMNETVEIKFVPSAKAMVRAAFDKRYPLTQYLYAILAHQNNMSRSTCTAGISLLKKIPANTFTDGKALGMFLSGWLPTMSTHTRACFTASPDAVADALALSVWPTRHTYARLIVRQILKKEANSKLLLNTINNNIKTSSHCKSRLLLGMLVYYREDAQLIKDIYRKLMDELENVPHSDVYTAATYIIPNTYKGTKSAENFTSADIRDPRCSEIKNFKNKYIRPYYWQSLIDVTDDMYYIDYQLFANLYIY